MSLNVSKSKDVKPNHSIGEKVLCFEPDETKARVLYNAKIMDADLIKDSNGRKFMEYKIHFQGWNSTWDRWADESFVLKDSEENRKLQRKLARRAIRKLKNQKGKKRHHLPGVAGVIKKIPNEEDLGTDSSSDESVDSATTNSGKGLITDTEEELPPEKRKKFDQPTLSNIPCQTIPNTDSSSADFLTKENLTPKRSTSIDIPYPLQRRLEEDATMIKRRGMLVDLPIFPNVVQILENYVKYFAINVAVSAEKIKAQLCAPTLPITTDGIPPEKRISLCQEVCADIRTLFDITLPLVLLYFPERPQFKHLVKKVYIQSKSSLSKGSPTGNSGSHKTTSSKRLSFEEPASSKSENGTIQVNNNAASEEKDQKTKPAINHDFTVQNGKCLNMKEKSKSCNMKTSHRKSKQTAEEVLIEETHKYILPNQANLDHIGLSNDSKGRRRSSRLSHSESTSCHALVPKVNSHDFDDEGFTDSDGFNNTDITPANEKSRKALSDKHKIKISSQIFLRGRKKMHKVSNSNQIGNYGVTQENFSTCNTISREEYLEHAGNDINHMVELSKVWNWTILPNDFKPPDGASVPPSLVYGIHHLLRMFVKLPEILPKMDVPEFKLKVLLKHVQTLLKFLKEYERELFEYDCYSPNTI